MTMTLNGSGTGTVGVPNRGTAVNASSGVTVTISGVAVGAKRVQLVLNGIVSNGSSPILVQLGTSGAIVTSGYACGATYTGSSSGGGNSTSGLMINGGSKSAGNILNGIMTLINISGTKWVSSHVFGQAGDTYSIQGGGTVDIGGDLYQLRLIAANGTDTFTAGAINIIYE